MKTLKKKFKKFYQIVISTYPFNGNGYWYSATYKPVEYYVEVVEHDISPYILFKSYESHELSKKLLLLDNLEPYKWFCSYFHHINCNNPKHGCLLQDINGIIENNKEFTSLREDFNKARKYIELSSKLTR